MSREVIVGIAYAALLVGQQAHAQSSVVNLNEPGVLTALESSNPAHYRKVVAILEQVRTREDSDVPRWMQRPSMRGTSGTYPSYWSAILRSGTCRSFSTIRATKRD